MPISNIVAGRPITATGGIKIGALSAATPTTVAGTTTGFTAAGYIGEDGLTESTDRSIEKVKAWGGSTVKVLQTDFQCTYSFMFLEALGTTTLNAVYGDDNVTPTAGGPSAGTKHTVLVNSESLEHQKFVFDIKDGDAAIRIVVPDGQVTEVGEITYSHNSVVGYQVTVEAFPDNAGNNAYKYMDDGVFIP